MAKILMTGSGGTVGTILKAGLTHQVTDYDLPSHSVLDFEQLRASAVGHDTIIHLAWAAKHDNWLTERFEPQNLQGAFNVFEASQLAGVKRVIIASSVHADDFVNYGHDDPLEPYSLPVPDSPYGAAKCMIEALGRYYASSKNIEVICIRFGGVNKNNKPPDSPVSERIVWLSNEDCVALIQSCIDAKPLNSNYAICYGISKNTGLIHNLINPFGWQPKDSAR